MIVDRTLHLGLLARFNAGILVVLIACDVIVTLAYGGLHWRLVSIPEMPLPLGLVDNLTWATPLGSALIGFMFLVMDGIGRDREDPFENTAYDVPMAAITRTIEIDLLQAIGSAEVPEPLKPQRGILL